MRSYYQNLNKREFDCSEEVFGRWIDLRCQECEGDDGDFVSSSCKMLESLTIFTRQTFQRVNEKSKNYSIALVIVLLLIEVWFALNGDVSGDYWEHNAVLKELIRNPWNPAHPVINSNIPHAFFSPYLLLLGIIGHYCSLTAFSILTIMALINLGLLLTGLYLFVRTFYRENTWSIFFLLLVFHLFAWGPWPWTYSSFFHFNNLHYVLPYPSTFAVACTFFAAYFFKGIETAKNKIVIISCITILNAIILLTHPPTFILLLALLASITIDKLKTQKINVVFWVIVISIPFAIVSFWPYYPFWDLLTAQPTDSEFHLDSKVLYENSLIRILPALTALLFLRNTFVAKNRALVICLVMLTVIYLYGFISNQFGFGRVISFIVLLLHLLLAHTFSSPSASDRRLPIAIVLIVILSLPYAYHTTKTFNRQFILIGEHRFNDDYRDLGKHIKHNEVVMTDMQSLRYLPAFAGKVTATVMPPYWIPDNDKRLQDVETFFIVPEKRVHIIKLYKVNYILLTGKYLSAYNSFLASIGRDENAVIFRNRECLLIKVSD